MQLVMPGAPLGHLACILVMLASVCITTTVECAESGLSSRCFDSDQDTDDHVTPRAPPQKSVDGCVGSQDEIDEDHEEDLSSMMQMAYVPVVSGGKPAPKMHEEDQGLAKKTSTKELLEKQAGELSSPDPLQQTPALPHNMPRADPHHPDNIAKDIWVGSVKAHIIGSSSDTPSTFAWDARSRFITLGGVCVFLMMLVTWAVGRRARTHFKASSAIQNNVRKLPVQSWAQVQRLLPATATDDSTISKDVSLPQLIRVEARIEGPAEKSREHLTAPLSKKDCVVFSVMVSQQKEGGLPPEPVAFKSNSISFLVSPVDAPKARIKVSGDEVSLFDIHGGLASDKMLLEDAPAHWQEFVQAHKAPHICLKETANLKFEECALFIGSVITLVGEPQLAADGTIRLVPRRIPEEVYSCPPAELPQQGTTSLTSETQSPVILDLLSAKVLASDNIELLHYWKPKKRRLRACCGTMFGWPFRPRDIKDFTPAGEKSSAPQPLSPAAEGSISPQPLEVDESAAQP